MELKLIGNFDLYLTGVFLVAFFQPPPNNCFSLTREQDSSVELTPPIKICGDGRVYINETQKCYPTRSRGPCAEMMLVERVPGNEIGKCACAQTNACTDRPTVYWPQDNRCYFIFEQGPCPPRQWLVPNNREVPTCEQIPCPEECDSLPKPMTASSPILFSYKGQCSTSPDPCSVNQLANLWDYEHECVKCAFYSLDGPPNNCKGGLEPDFQGGCEPFTVLN